MEVPGCMSRVEQLEEVIRNKLGRDRTVVAWANRFSGDLVAGDLHWGGGWAMGEIRQKKKWNEKTEPRLRLAWQGGKKESKLFFNGW
jgi:hypothetical protein